MPELPEVETTRLGVTPHILGERISAVIVRNRQLRWPVARIIGPRLRGQLLRQVHRRGKYLLLETDQGCLILHLGMSGSLRVLRQDIPPEKHDHVDLEFSNGVVLRFRDPRRFGSLHYTQTDPERHRLLRHLGPEPLGQEFNGEYLYLVTRNRRQAIKQLIMDSHIVPGIGNIYASESLFTAGIHPARAAGRIARSRYVRLVSCIQAVLVEAIAQGGTTLRDFSSGEGRPGYFRQRLQVYDRAGLSCHRCGRPIRQIRQGQRSTFYCPGCQK